MVKSCEIDWIRGRDFLILSDLDTDLPIVPTSEAITASDVIGPAVKFFNSAGEIMQDFAWGIWIPGLVNVYKKLWEDPPCY